MNTNELDVEKLIEESVKWEESVTANVAELLGITYADAAVIVWAHPFIIANGWTNEESPLEVAEKLTSL